MITVEVESAERTPSGVEVVALVDAMLVFEYGKPMWKITQKRIKVTIPSYVVTELLDDARVEYTTRDE